MNIAPRAGLKTRVGVFPLTAANESLAALRAGAIEGSSGTGALGNDAPVYVAGRGIAADQKVVRRVRCDRATDACRRGPHHLRIVTNVFPLPTATDGWKHARNEVATLG